MQSARRPVKTCWRSFCALWHSPGNGFAAMPCHLMPTGANRDRLRLMTIRIYPLCYCGFSAQVYCSECSLSAKLKNSENPEYFSSVSDSLRIITI